MSPPGDTKEYTMKRDREKTKAKILKAVGKILAEKGFQKVGINAIAREAGVDKVLIYRYFGGLPQLLKAYAEEGNFWPAVSELIGGDPADLADRDLVELSTTILTNHLRALRSLPVTQDIMRWELLHDNELTEELADRREKEGMELLRLLPFDPDTPDMDPSAVGALIHAGISYLILRSKTASSYLGVNLHSEEGWQRLEKTIQCLLKAYYGYFR
jgi:AcrR family transcriptional regulator